MNDYVIGSGALLSAGPNATIAGATLHAQTDPVLASQVQAALVDFEASSSSDLTRILVVASGWNGRRFELEVIRPLLAQGECTLGDVLGQLARATGAGEVHVFARWLPDEVVSAALRRDGVRLVSHPLEAIERAALISGQRYTRWNSPLRAA